MTQDGKQIDESLVLHTRRHPDDLEGEDNSRDLGEEYRKQLAKRIQEAIAMMDVSGNKQAAKGMGISDVQLYRYLNGQSIPTIAPMVALAKASGTDLNWLLMGEGEKNRELANQMRNWRAWKVNPELLAKIVSVTRHLIDEARIEASDTDYAKVVANIYNDLYATASTQSHGTRISAEASPDGKPKEVVDTDTAIHILFIKHWLNKDASRGS